MSENQDQTMSRRLSISEAHKRAPVCAAFVEALREVFGVVTVLYVKEGDFLLDRGNG